MASIFKMKQPAAGFGGTWREGTPIGNGLHGAMIYGRIRNEKIMMMHASLWRGGNHPDIPDVSDVLPEMRRRIMAGELPDADKMLVNMLRERGYKPGYAYMTPAADIEIDLPTEAVFRHYSRELDMENGVASVSYDLDGERILRRAFVSRADDVLVIDCAARSRVRFSIHKPDELKPDTTQMPENVVCESDGEWMYFRCTVKGEEHGGVARVIRGERTLIIARLYLEGSSETMWGQLREYIAALPTDYDELLARHEPLHRELFGSCRFRLTDSEANENLANEDLLAIAYDEEMPNALVQRMWDYGRYLFISGTAVGGYPCNLTGIWCGDYRATWSFNMANINLEMIYWHVLPGNLTELMIPVFDYYDSGITEFRENARQIYGCNGIFLPAVTMPGAMKNVCMGTHIVNWTGGAGWISQLYYDYWMYTRDERFLRERAVPFMREATAFYRDFILRGENEWHVCPSVSPENHTTIYRSQPVVGWHGSTQASIDATMDIAIIRELFGNLLSLGDIPDLITEEEKEECRWILNYSPAYAVNEYGAPREWLNDDFVDNDRHRHQSHLYPIFPGMERVRESSETDEIYRRGGIRRMKTGVDHQTSWSLIQNANMMARVKDADNAWNSLNIISKSCLMNNLFTTHNDWRGCGLTLVMPSAPFQIDANCGWPSAVIEMLLLSMPERIDILPALPAQWQEGAIGPLCTRCGCEVSIEWKETSAAVTIKAQRSTAFTLYMPDGSYEKIALREGDTIRRECRLNK